MLLCYTEETLVSRMLLFKIFSELCKVKMKNCQQCILSLEEVASWFIPRFGTFPDFSQHFLTTASCEKTVTISLMRNKLSFSYSKIFIRTYKRSWKCTRRFMCKSRKIDRKGRCAACDLLARFYERKQNYYTMRHHCSSFHSFRTFYYHLYLVSIFGTSDIAKTSEWRRVDARKSYDKGLW